MMTVESVRAMLGNVIVRSRASHRSSSVMYSLGMWIDSNHLSYPSVRKKLPLG